MFPFDDVIMGHKLNETINYLREANYDTLPLRNSANLKHRSVIEYHIYIWQVSLQLSCSGTCQIQTWFKESKRIFYQIENFTYGEIYEQSFSDPYPGFPALGHMTASASQDFLW